MKTKVADASIEDRPKLLGDPHFVCARLEELGAPHIAPLTNFVRNLRDRKGSGAVIPFIDPWDGGVEANVLFLLEAPSPNARHFVSMNNPDETAKNFHEVSREAGIDRRRIVTWNVVPWYIGDGQRIRPANRMDIAAGVESLVELLRLLPRLQSVMLVGRKAQVAEQDIRRAAPHLVLNHSPHPSRMFVNRRPENRGALLDAWRVAAQRDT